MLIRQRPSRTATTDTPRTEAAEIVPAPPLPDDSNEQIQAVPEPHREQPFEVWIMHGKLDRSLFQAGACRVLAEHHGLPRSVYASDFSTINAVLLAAGGGSTLDKGWERLRGKRLLFDEGLRELSLFRYFAPSSTRIGQTLAHELARLDLAESPIDLHLSAGNVDLDTNSSKAVALPVEGSTDDQTWRTAIDAAVAEGAARILLIGVDANPDGPLLKLASSSVKNAGTELAYIPYQTGEHPRPIDFLLPGSGVPERLVADGARAARIWLRTWLKEP